MTDIELVTKVVTDIHTSPQNPIEKFKNYNCTSHAVIYNLMNGDYMYQQDQFINICVHLEELKQVAVEELTKKYHENIPR